MAKPGDVIIVRDLDLESTHEMYEVFTRSVERLEDKVKEEQEFRSRMAEFAADKFGRGPHVINGVVYTICERNRVWFFKRSKTSNIKEVDNDDDRG